MRVPLVGERKNEILYIAVLGRANDQVAAGTKQLLREARQVKRSHQVLDYLRCDRYVKALVANRRRIVVHSELVKYQFWRRTLCKSKALGAAPLSIALHAGDGFRAVSNNV